ncbi:lysophospholipid acyltransferase family protein [Peptostreptococcus faecalis]|uniref:lysophospholipid acyltransferase family protein n=1 Tax=Peptostreptococcus faecalis TaxID=2045015 RepID=UPI000C7B7CEF|nr:lysophospholipid acyltransferase family protein [Peptostreptococcus faecalis]
MDKAYAVIRKILSIFFSIIYRIEILGSEKLPNEGKQIIIANHKHNFDPLLMIMAVKNRRIIPVAKQELFKIPIIKTILVKFEVIPIDRKNPGLSTVKNILKQIKTGRVLGIFPEGTRSEMDSFLPAKPGVALFAIKSKADIVPMSIISSYKPFSKVKIVIGDVIDMSEYNTRKVDKAEYEKIAQSLLNVVEKNYNDNKEGIIK